jgi:nucleoside 2-deoxyribosyltransferase
MLKIYFAASIRAGREMADEYLELIRYLQSLGHVYTEHIGDEKAIIKDNANLDDTGIYERDMDWLVSADLIVAEVSVPSLGVGYEVGYAFSLGKPVVCLYNRHSGHRLSAMISGNKRVKIISWESLEDVKKQLAQYISTLEIVD